MTFDSGFNKEELGSHIIVALGSYLLNVLLLSLSEELRREQGRPFYRELSPYLLFGKARGPFASVTPMAVEVIRGPWDKGNQGYKEPTMLSALLSLYLP